MIKVKLSSVSKEQPREGLPIKAGETVLDAVMRSLEKVPLGKHKVEEVFAVLHNGAKCPPHLWEKIRLVERDQVLIVPVLQGDDGLGRGAFIALTALVASNLIAPGLGLTAFASGVFTLGVTLAVSSLLPPPSTEQPSTSFSDSQMYTIGSQSNAVKRLNMVPKVYGTHRMFPNVAANPYTEFEADPDTGKLVQYLYGIYDFGLGPMEVSDIRIGDTSIGDFSDVEYRLVDFNRPVSDEGAWDTPLQSSLSLYKGDVSTETLAITLNRNQEESPPLDTYEAIRNSAENSDEAPTTISLVFAFPQGLASFAANGEAGNASVDLEIAFQKIGDPDWRFWNDENYVSDFKGVGGDFDFQASKREIFPLRTNNITNEFSIYTVLRTFDIQYVNINTNPNEPFNIYIERVKRGYGYPAGATQIILKKAGAGQTEIQAGDEITFYGQKIGTVQSITTYLGDGSGQYNQITLASPLTSPIELFIAQVNDSIEPRYIPLDDAVANKIESRRVVLGRGRVTRNSTDTTYATYRFTPRGTPGQYRIRVRRIRTSSVFTSQVLSNMVWNQIQTRFDRDPISTTKRHVFLEMKIRATNQLNGTISNLSATCSSVLDVWDGSAWVKERTANPAWVFVDLLTGAVNKRAIDKARIDIPSVEEWADYCDEIPPAPTGYTNSFPRFECNFVLDFQTTLQGVLDQVANAANASLNLIDGKYGVLLDKQRTVPVQIFTPRNSRNFASQRAYPPKPNVLKVKFVDPARNWDISEIPVYDSGFNETNAIEEEEIQSFACTNVEQAWRFGRYILFSNRLRQETMSLEVDFEHLVCTRGDFVQITQDVMKVGGTPARVSGVSGNNVTIDDGIETGPFSYGYVFRAVDGQIKSGTISNIVSSDTFEFDNDLPDVGDLVVIGEVGSIVYDCLVKAITPNDDLSATLTLIEKADALYDYESADVFPEYDPLISRTVDPDFAPPGEVQDFVVADNAYECDGQNGYQYYIDLAWDPPSNSAYEAFEIFANSGQGFESVGVTRSLILRYLVDAANIGVEHSFKVVALSATGNKLPLGEVDSIEATPLPKTDPPSDIAVFSSDITEEVLQLTWERILDCDCREYLIRYSPALDATWESTIPLVRVDKNTNSVSVQARTGSYLIKAVDFNGNESVLAKAIITTIPELFNLNVVDEIDDFPALEGTFERTVDGGESILLQESVSGPLPEDVEYFSDGYYYYSSLLDLGDIFTVRLQSSIRAEGFSADDLMINWTTLDAVLALANTNADEWDVVTEYRATDALVVMSDWVTLDSIDPIGAGADDDFTVWRPFTITDATGRVFQFRLRLISNKPSVTPRVFEGTIKADMADREEIFTNLVAPDTGLEVTFDRPFKGPSPAPSIQVTIENGQSGDYVEYVSKTLEGFEVRFYDNNDNPVSRQFDAHVRGYGRGADATI